MSILVIEDSPLLRHAIARMLVKAGYTVTAARNGEEGLQKAQQSHPALIVLDIMLPTLSGTAVLRRLKQDPLTESIPIVILSSLSQRNEEKLKEDGAACYFEKSTLSFDGDGAVLVNTIGQLLKRLHRQSTNV